MQSIINTAKLLSLPEIYLRLKRLMAEPDFAMAEVALVISHDPSLTARLLKIVNSSLYSFPTPVETVSRAITLLGTQQIHDIILVTAVAEAFKGMAPGIMDVRRFWRCAMQCAVTCRHLAAISQGSDQERLFAAGLLCDIGHLLMYQAVPESMQQAIFLARETKLPMDQAERQILGFDYTEVGATLMEQWQLPTSLCTTTRYHNRIEEAKEFQLDVALVHLAQRMTRADDGEGEFDRGNLKVASAAWEISGLQAQDCMELSGSIAEDVRIAMELIFV